MARNGGRLLSLSPEDGRGGFRLESPARIGYDQPCLTPGGSDTDSPSTRVCIHTGQDACVGGQCELACDHVDLVAIEDVLRRAGASLQRQPGYP